MLNAGQIRDYQIGTFAYQCSNNIALKVFSNLFKRNTFYHEYNTRNAEVLGSQERNTIRSGFTIKHFVVTNCSKERPGSIVTETLKNDTNSHIKRMAF